MTPVSLDPQTFVEGGAVPVDRNLTWEKVRWNLFEYTKKDGSSGGPATVALKVNYKDDDGNEFEQQYSAGNPDRFTISDDGKTLEPVTEGQGLSKSSNASILLAAMVSAGFPQNRLADMNGDVSKLDGLYAFHVGLPEPTRAGLTRPVVEGARPKLLSIPSRILRLPGEKGGKKAAPAAAKAAPKAESAEDSGSDDVLAKALKFVADHLEDGATTRQKLATAAFKDLAKDPDRDAVAGLLFKPEFAAALLGAGYSVSGEKISKS